MNNPLLQTFDEAPFRQIENKHYHEAFIEAIKLAKEEISQIVENPEQPSFENTIESLEYSGEQLSRISSIFFNLNSAETNDEIQQIANEISPLLSEFGNDITLNEALFTRVKAVYEQKDVLELNEEQTTLLEKHYKSFTRNGALLSEEDKVKLREIDKDLSAKSLKFGQNLLADTNNYFLHITDELDLKGLPENVKEAAKAQAVSKEKEGWVFTLDYPSYVPFMQYADNRDLRLSLIHI